ncbi:hypothetical protein SMICM304S_02592 [Streptomyces microflavus]
MAAPSRRSTAASSAYADGAGIAEGAAARASAGAAVEGVAPRPRAPATSSRETPRRARELRLMGGSFSGDVWGRTEKEFDMDIT